METRKHGIAACHRGGVYSKFLLALFLLVNLCSFAIAQAQITSPVSINRAGTGTGNQGSVLVPDRRLSPPRNDSSSSVVTPDGRYVALYSAATDLVAGSISGTQIYVRDLVEGTTKLVSVNRAGTGGGNDDSLDAVISIDGRFVAFISYADDLVEKDTNKNSDVFVRDLVIGTTSLVSINRTGTDSGTGTPLYSNGNPVNPEVMSYYHFMSTDGRRVFFLSYASDLVANDTNNTSDIFVRDLQTGSTSCVNVNRADVPTGDRTSLTSGGDFSFEPVINADGRYVAFQSYVNDLVENDKVCSEACNGTNGLPDIFVRDVVDNKTTLVSVNRTGANSGNSSSSDATISADGRFIAFRSFSTDLVNNDTTPQADIYLRDMASSITTLVSVNRDGTNGGSSASARENGGGVNHYWPLISGNGRFVAFSSPADDLAPNKTNVLYMDVFVRDLLAGTTVLASVSREGNDGRRPLNTDSLPQAFSHDGRFLIFKSAANDLAANDTNTDRDIFVRDLAARATTLVNVNLSGVSSSNGASAEGRISADGRLLVFDISAPDIVENDTNNARDVFTHPVFHPIFQTNPLEDSYYFVRQQYRDFLNREPDAPGLAFWTDNIVKCNDPARRPAGQTLEQCVDKQQETTSAAFFLSPEFKYTGYFVYRFYKGSLLGGPNYDGGSPGVFPLYANFIRDVRQVASGIIVDNKLSGEKIEANRAAFAEQFVLRTGLSGFSNEQYIDRLFATTTIAPTAAERQALIDGLNNNTESRATVLRKIVDGTRVLSEGQEEFQTRYGKAFYDQEFKRAFVLMEYFGYLRRDPDTAGYNHWLGKLNLYGNYLDAEMVRSFLISPEYRSRFGQQ